VDELPSANLSVIDRLLDDDPDQAQDREESLGQYIERFRTGLRRDLEALLNTRRRFLSWPAEYGELRTSLLNFGVPDFTNDDLTNAKISEALRLSIIEIIKRLEPRLLSAEVTLDVFSIETERALVFRISGFARIRDKHEALQFQASVEPIERLVFVEAQS
jgi:type VI secretion system protein ImpF